MYACYDLNVHKKYEVEALNKRTRSANENYRMHLFARQELEGPHHRNQLSHRFIHRVEVINCEIWIITNKTDLGMKIILYIVCFKPLILMYSKINVFNEKHTQKFRSFKSVRGLNGLIIVISSNDLWTLSNNDYRLIQKYYLNSFK